MIVLSDRCDHCGAGMLPLLLETGGDTLLAMWWCRWCNGPPQRRTPVMPAQNVVPEWLLLGVQVAPAHGMGKIELTPLGAAE